MNRRAFLRAVSGFVAVAPAVALLPGKFFGGPAVSTVDGILDRIAAGVGIPKRILVGDPSPSVVWMASPPAAGCPACESADAPSIVWPDWDSGVPPFHPNCRCTVAPLGELREITLPEFRPVDDDDYVVGLRRTEPISFDVEFERTRDLVATPREKIVERTERARAIAESEISRFRRRWFSE